MFALRADWPVSLQLGNTSQWFQDTAALVIISISLGTADSTAVNRLGFMLQLLSVTPVRPSDFAKIPMKLQFIS